MRVVEWYLLSALLIGWLVYFTIDVIKSADDDRPPKTLDAASWDRVAQADWRKMFPDDGDQPSLGGHTTWSELARAVAEAFRKGKDVPEVELEEERVRAIMEAERATALSESGDGVERTLDRILQAGSGADPEARSLILTLLVPIHDEWLEKAREGMEKIDEPGTTRSEREMMRAWASFIDRLPEPTRTTRRNYALVQKIQEEERKRWRK